MNTVAAITDNWTTIAEILGSWAVLASLLNRVWPRPESPRWLAVLHVVLIDWPAALPARGMTGAVLRGAMSVPFVTTSRRVEDPPSDPPVPPAALVLLALSLGGCDSEIATVAAVSVATAFVTATLMLAAAAVLHGIARLRARRRADELDERETYRAPDLSEAHARAIEYAVREKRLRSLGFEDVTDEQKARNRLVNFGSSVVVLSLLSGCAPAWATAGAIADAATVAVSRYQAWTHAERRQIVAASGCESAPACEAAIAPFEARQRPVLACLKAVAPMVEAGALAAETKDLTAARSMLPALAVQVPACVAEIARAKGERP